MLKYGRLALAESLSGTPGQVVPVRAQIAAAIVPGALDTPLAATADEPDATSPSRSGRRRRRPPAAIQIGAEQESGA
jgi:hypothetical protein